MKTVVKEYVGVASRFTRSVNLNADYSRETQEYGYIVTGNVLSSLNQILSGLIKKGGQKSYCLFGLYGSGKSAFAVYLAQLLSMDNEQGQKARELLQGRAIDPTIDNFLADRNKSSYLPVLVTGRRRPINQLVMESMIDALRQLPEEKDNLELLSELQGQLISECWHDSQTVLQAIDKLGSAAKKAGLAGILLIVDEAGKSFEYALSDREGGDVFILQELAEHAERMSKYSMLFVITMHQQMDSYSELLSRTNRAEWAKIQERFVNIRFAEPASSTIQMLAEAIKPLKSAPNGVKQALESVINDLLKIEGIIPLGLSQESFTKSVYKAWPIHPTLLLALPYIFKRFAQNERSIFSYLASEEYAGFQNSIRDNVVEDDYGFIRIKDIYDYLLSNYEIGLSRNPHSKKMLEANDVINSRSRLTNIQTSALKTIAVLNSLSEISPLRATKAMLELSLPQGVDIESILQSMLEQSLITFRKLDSSYRIWEGSDVDLEERLNEARRHLHFDTQLFLDTIDKHLKQKHMVARRHSLVAGMIRYFCIEYSDSLANTSSILEQELAEGAAGLVLVLIPNEPFSDLVKEVKAITKKYLHLMVAIPSQMDSLSGVVNELACLKWVEEHTVELRDDRIARRELNLRIAAYEQELSKRAYTIIDPRSNPLGNECLWFWLGKQQETRNPVDISKLLSKACDMLYHKSPILRNELISRNDISSAASAARRNLMKLILTNPDQETLGMTGYPPERSIYESILKAAGIHMYDEKLERWKFQAPPNGNFVNLRPAWLLIEKSVFNDKLEEVELTALYAKLRKAPYGLPEGIFPILITAFFIVHQGEVFLYREGTFLPEPQSGHFDLLQRRLDLFSIKGVKLEGIPNRIVERLADSLNAPPKIASVVRALYRSFSSLPNLTLKSGKVSDPQALQVRESFLNASSPESLLFKNLPQCFGIEVLGSKPATDDDFDAYFRGLNAALQHLAMHAQGVLSTARDQLLISCGLDKGIEGWIELEDRCRILTDRIKHSELTPFINSVLNGAKENHDPVPALSNVSKRSFENWLDADVDRFEGLAMGMGNLFIRYWNSFGTLADEYTNGTAEQASVFRQEMRAQISNMKGNLPTQEIRRIIQELLAELQEDEEINGKN